jgi:hypothetical protein
MVSKIIQLTMLVALKCITLQSNAQITNYKLLNQKISLYEKAEWDIELKAEWSNPYIFDDIALDMIIIPGKGKKYTLPCYYVSGHSNSTSNWKARLAPIAPGNHKYYFVLTVKSKKKDSTAISTFSVEKSNKKGILQPSGNWTFQYSNGEHFRGIGKNIGWESREEDDSKYFRELHENPKYNYEYMVRTLAANGGNFFRTWMCQWNLPLEWKNPANNKRYSSSDEHFNPSAILKMDRLVNLCDSLNVHFMLAIDAHVNLMGDFWKANNYNKQNGGYAETISDFFTSEKAKLQYKNKLRYMVARWSYSPAIGAWEFFNEIDHVMFGPKDSVLISHQIITGWHHEMSTFLKQVDPYNHIVTTSISHREINGLNDVKNIDLNQKHIYCHTDGIPEAIDEKLKHGKPFTVGEYGYHWDWGINFNEHAENFDADFRKGLWYGLFSPTPVLPMSWWWEFFDNRGTIAYISKVRRIYDLMMQAGKGKFVPFTVNTDAENIKPYAVKCGKKTFIYLVNNSKISAMANLTFEANKNQKKLNYQMFNTLTGEFGPIIKAVSTKNKCLIKGISLDAGKDCIIVANFQAK